jgi:autotransporter-associated beta strand protein
MKAVAFTAMLALMTSTAQAVTNVWDNSNVTGTPPATLDWFTGGSNPLGLWTGVVVPVSASDTEIRFFANTTTKLLNTAVPSTQTNNLNNGGAAFQLGTLSLNGLGSDTSGASLTMTLQGDALNFSAATGTISFNSVKNVAPANDTVVNYNINNNIQLGTASSGSVLTLTGNGDNAGTTTYKIDGTISELQTGGGSLVKSGSSLVTISGAINITGGVTVNVGTLTLSSSTINASTMTVNGGTLILTGNLNPASASMTVNSGGALRIGNNTATQFNSGNYAGNISTGTGGTLQLWSTSAQEFSGIISGAGGIDKAYGGTLTLYGANTYTGKSQFMPETTAGFTVNVSSFNSVNGGTPLLASSSLGAPTTVANGTIDVGDGGKQAGVNLTYVSTATGETTDRVINLAFNGTSAQTITANNASGVLRFTSAFTSNTGTSGRLILSGSGAGQIDLGLPQLPTGGLDKSGAGTWTLGGSCSFTGPTKINAGTLSLSSATALQNSPFDTTSVAGGAAAGLKIATTALTLGGLTGANALRGRFTTALGGPSSATVQGGYDGLTDLILNTAAASASTYSGAIAEGATGMSLTKTGAGIQTLSGVHGYTGTTSVNGGFLQLNGNTLAGGLSVSNATLASNSSFAGLATVASGGVIAPGASLGAIGTLTINNASASALTLGGSTVIFDLPATVTTPDQLVVTGGGGLVLNGTNTVILQTPATGTPAGTYTLMTFTGAHTGAGSLVFANGSTTMGNASLSVSAGLVQLTVAAGGLVGTSTFNGAGGTGNANNWTTAARWNTGVVPSGTTNITLAPTGTQGVTANDALVPTYSGNLTINPGVVLQIGWTTAFPAATNALGTAGTTTIFMGAGSRFNIRNAGSGTFSDIVLLGNANVSLGESTQTGMAATFRSITGPYAFSLYTHGIGGAAGSANFTMANSFTTLNLSGAVGAPLTASVANSIGTATVNMSSGVKMILNATGAMADSANIIRINDGTLEQGTGAGVTAALSLPTRAIELNGAGQATIKNSNTASSSANIMTLGGGISSTAAGAKTLTLGGANTGANTISGNIVNGSAGSIALTKADAGTWVLSGTNTYSGATTVSAGKLAIQSENALGSISAGTSVVDNGPVLQLLGDISFAAEPLSLPNNNNNPVLLQNVSGSNIWNGTITTTGTAGSFARISSDSGLLTLANTIATSYSSASVVLQGDGAITVSGKITGSSGLISGSVGSGIRTVSNANNDYTGKTVISGGTLSINSLANVNGGASSLGAPATVADGTIGIGSTTSSGTLQYTGGGHASDRVINLAGTTGGATLDASGAGALVLTTNLTATGAGSKTLTLTGTSTATNTLGGAIVDNSAVNKTSLIKTDVGTWVLSGSNTYTGTTSVRVGTLTGVTGGSCLGSSVTVTNTPGNTSALAIRVTETNAQWSCANLAFTTNGLGAQLKFSFAVAPSKTLAPLSITNNLAFTGAPVVVLNTANVPEGTYPLLVAGGTAPTAIPALDLMGSTLKGTLAWGGAGNKTLYLSLVSTATVISFF